MENKKQKIIIIGLLVIIVIIVLITLFIRRDIPSTPESDQPVQVNGEEIITVDELPWDDETGVDLESETVKGSQSAVSQIASALPYSYSFTTSEGIDVEVTISSSLIEFQDWVLPISVYGPDYQVPVDDPEYEIHKKAFLEGAAHALEFIQSQGVDTSTVIIDWGHRELIRNRALEWLNNP